MFRLKGALQAKSNSKSQLLELLSLLVLLIFHFRRFSKNFEKLLLAASCLSVRPSVRMEHLGSHLTDLDEI